MVYLARDRLMDIWAVSSSVPLQMALVFKDKHSSNYTHICLTLLSIVWFDFRYGIGF